MSTRSAKAAAASKLQQISAADNEDSEINDSDDVETTSSDEESDYGSARKASKQGEPPNKRAKHSVASTPRKPAVTPKKRGKKSLSLLPTMPLDVLFEILGQLSPKDLLHVSRTNKLFRETLLSSGAKTVWKHALQSLGAPECPSDLRDTQWAMLLFGTSCVTDRSQTRILGRVVQWLCVVRFPHVPFSAERYFLPACKKKNLLVKSKVASAFPGYNQSILSFIPSTDVGGWAHGHASSSQFFWRSDIEKMIRTVAAYEQKKHPKAENELATFMQQRILLVHEINSTARKFETWVYRAKQDRLAEAEKSKDSRVDAIYGKFRELGYEESDIKCIRSEKACNQKAALTDSIWKRIRPVLEPIIQKRRDVRLAREKIPIVKARRNILNELYTHYEGSISPPLWKYLPSILEICEKEPFKAVIDAELSVAVTKADFLPLTVKFPEVITQIQDELKAQLVEKLTEALEPGQVLPSNCLELATTVFRCQGRYCRPEIFVVGIDNILSHNCGSDATFGQYYNPYDFGAGNTLRDFVIDPIAVTAARSIVLCAGLDPRKTLASEMDNKDLRFGCACTGNKSIGYSWRAALSHAVNHQKRSTSFDLRLLSPPEVAILKQNEERDPKWALPKWSCSYCSTFLSSGGLERDVVVLHVRTKHDIIVPTVPTDFFYFEKVATPFRQPEKLLYTPPIIPPVKNAGDYTKTVGYNNKNVLCLRCASGPPSARDRLFDVQGVVNHLNAKHSVASPQEGVHWSRRRGP